jgi:hypothetical protein
MTSRFRDRMQLDVEEMSSSSVSFVVVANGSPSGIFIVTLELTVPIGW